MSEASTDSGGEGAGASLDPSLTIPKRRLADSGHCLNCGAGLEGPYCHHCGQPDRRFLRVLPVLLRDLMADLVDLDARFLRTLAPLLFRPGTVTQEFLAGRRFRYTPPLRLYLFSSVLFFLLAAVLGAEFIQVGDGDGEETVVRFVGTEDEPDAPSGGAGAAVEDEQDADPDEADGDGDVVMSFNGDPWDKETNPVDIGFLPAFANGWINDEIEDSPRKAKAIKENPGLFSDKMYELLPGTMFLLLPVAAFLLQFWYLLSKRYFVEHLIFALHAHAFTFLVMSVSMVAGSLQELSFAHGIAWAGWLATGLEVTTLLWVPLYFLLALKRVYRQGWFATLFKFGAIGSCYSVLLLLVTGAVALLSFILL